MDWDILKKFKKQYHLAEKAVRDMSQIAISTSIEFEKEKGSKCDLHLPPEKEISRLANVLRLLADSDSTLYFRKVAEMLMEEKIEALSLSEKENLQKQVRSVEDGPMRFKINNDTALTASELYGLYAKGAYFSETIDEAKRISDIKTILFANQLVLFNFYSYCYDVYNICGYLYYLIRQEEARQAQSAIFQSIRDKEKVCIYCLSRKNDFKSEEHVYPESLGNTELILPPGCVCDLCNNAVLAELDEYLVNSEAISMLRLLYVPYNPKTGKFSTARYQNMTLEKIHPRKINIKIHGGKSNSLIVREDEGASHIKINALGRNKFDPRLLGRSLYKIGLGTVCWELGPDAALNKKYNAARQYVLGKRPFPNNLLVKSEIEPSPMIEGQFNTHERGTIFEISIYGFHVLFNLELQPVIEMNPELERMGMKLHSLNLST